MRRRPRQPLAPTSHRSRLVIARRSAARGTLSPLKRVITKCGIPTAAGDSATATVPWAPFPTVGGTIDDKHRQLDRRKSGSDDRGLAAIILQTPHGSLTASPGSICFVASDHSSVSPYSSGLVFASHNRQKHRRAREWRRAIQSTVPVQ